MNSLSSSNVSLVKKTVKKLNLPKRPVGEPSEPKSLNKRSVSNVKNNEALEVSGQLRTSIQNPLYANAKTPTQPVLSMKLLKRTQKLNEKSLSSLGNPAVRTKDSSDELKEAANKEAKRLERKFQSSLKGVSEGTPEYFKKHTEFLAKIIKNDKAFGGLLATIKEAYESKIRQIESGPLYELHLKLKEEKNSLLEGRKLKYNETQFLESKIKTLSRQNVEISRKLQTVEEKYSEIQEKFASFSQENKEQQPRTDDAWRFLIAENRNYEEIYNHLQDESKNYRSKEKRLLKLIEAIKARGVPVDEILLAKERGHQHSPLATPSSETDRITEDAPKPVLRPSVVPSLHLASLQNESYSSSTSSEHSESPSEGTSPDTDE